MMWRCRSSPWRGKPVLVWQFMQRGCSSTGSICSKSAADRDSRADAALAGARAGSPTSAARPAGTLANAITHASAAARALWRPAGLRPDTINSSRAGSGGQSRSGVHRLADPLVCAAAANVGDGGVDFGVGRRAVGREERRNGHDHSALAIAALRYLLANPCLLHGMRAPVREPLDGRDLPPAGGGERKGARAHGVAVDVHGTRAAERLPAAVLRTGEPELLAQNPEERGGRIGFDAHGLAVDAELHQFVFLM